jgi:type I restriction enzyme S subunit
MENNLPLDWEIADLSELVNYKKGKKPKQINSQVFKDSLPYLDIKAIEKGLNGDFVDIKSSVHTNEDDIVIVWDGARAGWVGKSRLGALGSTLMKLKPFINKDYLYRYLQTQFHYLHSNQRGTGIPHVDPEIFWNISVPVPPLPEQHRIVIKLDSLMERVDRNKKRLDKIPVLLKRFRQSVLATAVSGRLTEDWREKNTIKVGFLEPGNHEEQLFTIPETWEFSIANKVCDKITDGEHNTPQRKNEGKILLSAKNIRDGFIDYTDIDFISEEDFEKCVKRCNPEVGDVLIVSVGATIGRTAIKRENVEFGIVRSVGLFKPNKEKILGEYLLHVLRAPIIQKFISEESQGTAQPCFYIHKMEIVPIPLPPILEQHEIIHRVAQLFSLADKIESRYNKAKAVIDKLPQSILAKAFRGELVPQDPNDEPASVLLERIREEKNRINLGRQKITKNKRR